MRCSAKINPNLVFVENSVFSGVAESSKNVTFRVKPELWVAFCMVCTTGGYFSHACAL